MTGAKRKWTEKIIYKIASAIKQKLPGQRKSDGGLKDQLTGISALFTSLRAHRQEASQRTWAMLEIFRSGNNFAAFKYIICRVSKLWKVYGASSPPRRRTMYALSYKNKNPMGEEGKDEKRAKMHVVKYSGAYLINQRRYHIIFFVSVSSGPLPSSFSLEQHRCEDEKISSEEANKKSSSRINWISHSKRQRNRRRLTS